MELTQKFWNILITALLVIGLVLAVFSWFHKADSKMHTITTVGTGEVKVKPDLFMVNYSIKNKHTDSRQAAELTSAQAKEILNKLKDLAIEDKDIKTTDMSTSEVWQSTEDKGKPKEFEARESVQVTIHDNLQQLNKALDVIKNSGNTVFLERVDSTISEQNKAVKELSAKAFANAKEKAENYATVGNFKLRKVVQLSDNSTDNAGPTPRMMMSAAVAADKAPADTAYQVGEKSINTSVTVTWEIS